MSVSPLVLQLESQLPTLGAPGQLLVHQLLKAVQWCVLWRTEKTLPWPGTEEREDWITQIVTNTPICLYPLEKKDAKPVSNPTINLNIEEHCLQHAGITTIYSINILDVL